MDEVQIEQWKKSHTKDERRRWFILASRFGYVHGHYETERVGQKLEVAFAASVVEGRCNVAKWTTLDAAASLYDMGVFGKGFRPTDAHLREVASRIEVAGRAWAQGDGAEEAVRAISKAIAEEREACAKVVECSNAMGFGGIAENVLQEAAANIRARGNDGTTKDGAGEQGISGSGCDVGGHAGSPEGPP